MHLWQIRHIPNYPQTSLRLTFLASAIAFVGVSSYPQVSFVLGQTSEVAPDKQKSPETAEATKEFLDRVRQELPKHRTIKADLAQAISIGEQQFRVEGQYVSALASAAAGQTVNKLRLTYQVIPDQGVRAKILEICDGKELWTELTLPEPSLVPPESKRVTRRNVQQILAAAVAANKRNIPESTISVELGLGGVSALLASLERTMLFETMREEENNGRTRTIVQGRWKKELADRFQRDKDNVMPPFVPDAVRLYIDNQTLFPEKVLYLKKQPQKKTFKSLVSLEFSHVEFDGPVDETEFVYNLPDKIVPEDVTKQYVDRLSAPPADAPATKTLP